MAPPNDTFTQLNKAVVTGGDAMDETAAAYGSAPLIRKRPRVVLGGDADPTKLVDPLDTTPVGDEVAIPTRQVGPIVPERSTVSSCLVVPASLTSVQLAPPNSERLGKAIYNESTSVLIVYLGDTADATHKTVAVAPGGYYEIPFAWAGAVAGYWLTAAVGSAFVTRLT